MAISCDPSTLANAARCFDSCVPDGMQQALKTSLLCQYSNVPVGPPPPTNPDIADASVFNDVIFTWTNPVPAGTSNEVWKSTNGAAFVLYSTVGGAVSSFHDPIALGFFLPTDFFTYKVRTISAAGTSAFSATRSATKGVVKTGAADATVSFPDLVMQLSNGGSGLFFDNMPNLTSFSAPLLRRVDDQMTFSGSAALVTVTIPAIVTVGETNSDNFFFDNCTSLAALNVPNLTRTGGGGGNFHLTGCTSLASLNLPLFVNAGGDFLIDGCSSLISLSFPAMTGVAETLSTQSDISLQFISCPLLQSCGTGLNISGCNSLTSATFPLLTDLSGGPFLAAADPVLSSLVLTVLNSVGGDFDISGCGALVTLSLPALASLGGNLTANGSFSLTNFSIPLLIFQDGFTVIFLGCNLIAGSSAGGTGVNGILRRLVASGVTTDNIDLSGGTNAPPNNAAGNTGIIDKTTLSIAGNTVSTN